MQPLKVILGNVGKYSQVAADMVGVRDIYMHT